MTKQGLKVTRLALGTKPVERATAQGRKDIADRPKPGGHGLETVIQKPFGLGSDPETLQRAVGRILLQFVRTVDPRDFCCFAFILAHGNRSKAAQALGMVERTLYKQVDSWATRGPEYQRMLTLLECRKVGLCKETVPLSLAVQSGERGEEAENPGSMEAVLDEIAAGDSSDRDYPGLLRDLLGAMKAMEATNWQAIRTEVIALLEEELGQVS